MEDGAGKPGWGVGLLALRSGMVEGDGVCDEAGRGWGLGLGGRLLRFDAVATHPRGGQGTLGAPKRPGCQAKSSTGSEVSWPMYWKAESLAVRLASHDGFKNAA